MFDIGTGVEVGAGGGEWATHVGRGWKEIDRQMRRLARSRAALDAEELPLLLAAKRAEVHKHLGYGTFTEYLERACGYAPTTARDRLRVAESLEVLPAMRAALAAGDLSYSIVRELTRVAKPHNEEDWIVSVERCTVRDVEQLVRGHAPGDHPEDPPAPDLEPRTLHLELPPQVYALWLEARRVLEARTGTSMTAAELLAELARAALAGTGPASTAALARTAPAGTAPAGTMPAGTAPARAAPAGTALAGSSAPDAPADTLADLTTAAPDHNEPPYQIAVSVCPDCQRGWQDAGSKSIELPPATVERMRCDAVELGRVDGAEPAERVRTIPAHIRRAALARDHHRCTIPGCRSSQFVDLHHLQRWSRGGEHTLTNLTTLCGLHHDAEHDGRIRISGIPGALTVTHADGRPYGAPPSPSVRRPSVTGLASSLISDAKQALIQLGFRPAEAAAAVDSAATHVGGESTLESLIRAALRACPRSTRT